MLALRRTMFLIASVVVVAGCSEVGTPDSGKARIRNDTEETVLIWRCSRVSCKSARIAVGPFEEIFPDKFELRPGEFTGYVNISRRGAPNPFLVLDPETKQWRGCLPFVMPEYVKSGLTGRVSQLVPCRSDYDDDTQWPPSSRH